MSDQEAPIEVCKRQAKLFNFGFKAFSAVLVIYILMYLAGAVGLFFKPMTEDELSRSVIFGSSSVSSIFETNLSSTE